METNIQNRTKSGHLNIVLGASFPTKSGAPLDKLKHLRKVEREPLNTAQKLRNRAKAKYVSDALTKQLITLNSPYRSRYENSLRCATQIIQKEGKLTSHYCGSRWCLVCCRIRTGKYINVYEPIVSTWTDRHLVTLTIPNCKGLELSSTVDLMLKTFRQIVDMARKRKTPFVGIRKLEVTYNDKRNDYHPHLHVLIEGKENAEMLRDGWLKRLPMASYEAQDIQKSEGNDLKEIFKYFTKIFSRDKETKEVKRVNVAALDVVIRTLHGRRTFQSFGFKLPTEINEEDAMVLEESTDAGELNDGTERTYTWYGSGWASMDDGLVLADYEVSQDIENLLRKSGLKDDS